MEHHDKVDRQFGSRAQAYLESAVHARGQDLQHLAALAAALSADARVLDMGCGAGHASFAMAPHVGEVVAYDLSRDMLAVVRDAAAQRGLSSVRTEQGPAEQLPFEAAAFDLVVSRYSAHHWSDPAAALREAARVLKPGGSLCFIDVMGPQGPHATLLDTHLQALELLRAGRSPRELAESLGVSQQTLRNWRRQDQIDRRVRDDGLTTDERAELARLRRENQRLRQERDLLKRAAAFFAAENGTR